MSRLALVNVRALTNNTFLLNYFLTSRDVNLMLMSEACLHVGESSPFSELLPRGHLFFSSLRTSGRGGGLVTVFKSTFSCSRLPLDSLSTFEVQTFVISFDTPILCATVYVVNLALRLKNNSLILLISNNLLKAQHMKKVICSMLYCLLA